jgi:hypothetical protein
VHLQDTPLLGLPGGGFGASSSTALFNVQHVNNNPVNCIDPSGNFIACPVDSNCEVPPPPPPPGSGGGEPPRTLTKIWVKIYQEINLNPGFHPAGSLDVPFTGVKPDPSWFYKIIDAGVVISELFRAIAQGNKGRTSDLQWGIFYTFYPESGMLVVDETFINNHTLLDMRYVLTITIKQWQKGPESISYWETSELTYSGIVSGGENARFNFPILTVPIWQLIDQILFTIFFYRDTDTTSYVGVGRIYIP